MVCATTIINSLQVFFFIFITFLINSIQSSTRDYFVSHQIINLFRMRIFNFTIKPVLAIHT